MGTLSNQRGEPQVRKTIEHVLQNTEEQERMSSKNLWGFFLILLGNERSRVDQLLTYILSCLQPVPHNHS